MTHDIVLLEGDGIGPEISKAVTKIIDATGVKINYHRYIVGIQALEKYGVLIPDDVFEAIARIREKSDIPLVFLTYINPVFYYGYDKFFAKCKELDICGIISPDLPYDEKDEILDVATENDVDVISLVAPTSKERIQMIASEATGFIYVVSSLGVTGMRSNIRTDLKSILEDIKEVTDVPAAVGFGINTPEQAENISKIADGVIVGSAIVNIIAEHGENAKEPLVKYVKSMKDAISK